MTKLFNNQVTISKAKLRSIPQATQKLGLDEAVKQCGYLSMQNYPNFRRFSEGEEKRGTMGEVEWTAETRIERGYYTRRSVRKKLAKIKG